MAHAGRMNRSANRDSCREGESCRARHVSCFIGYYLLRSHASRLLRPLFRDEESMAKRRFLSVLAVPAAASALLGGVPAVAGAAPAAQAARAATAARGEGASVPGRLAFG